MCYGRRTAQAKQTTIDEDFPPEITTTYEYIITHADGSRTIQCRCMGAYEGAHVASTHSSVRLSRGRGGGPGRVGPVGLRVSDLRDLCIGIGTIRTIVEKTGEETTCTNKEEPAPENAPPPKPQKPILPPIDLPAPRRRTRSLTRARVDGSVTL